MSSQIVENQPKSGSRDHTPLWVDVFISHISYNWDLIAKIGEDTGDNHDRSGGQQ